ncbi:MAG: tetratricopeptide repeat protein [Lachnospiraceae bacterium]
MEVVRRKSDRPPVLLVLVILAAIVAAAVGISALANSPSAKLSRALKKAEKSYAARDYDGAAEAAQEALSLDASSTAAYRILIDTYEKQENYDALCAAYQDAADRLPEEDANALRNKVLTALNTAAQAAESSGDNDTAKSLYQSVVSIASPGSQLATTAQEKIDAMNQAAEEEDDPRTQYEEILKTDPDNTDALRGLADACEEEGDSDGARSALKKLIDLDTTDDESLLLEYVSLCVEDEDYDAALEVLNAAYARTKSQTLYAKILSCMAAKAKSATGTEAVDLWQAVLRKSPKYVDAYMGLSDLYYDLGEYDKAVHILETGYELTKDSLLSKQLSALNKKLAAAGITVDDDDTNNPVEELAQYAAENNYADALKVMAKKEFQDKITELADTADEKGRITLSSEDFPETEDANESDDEASSSTASSSSSGSSSSSSASASSSASTDEDGGDEEDTEPVTIKVVINEEDKQFYINTEDGTEVTAYWPAVTDTAGRVVIGEYGEDSYGNANYELSDGTVLTAYEYLVKYAP